MSKQENMPEAVASATFSLKTPGGYSLLFTVRSEDEDKLLHKVIDLDHKFSSELGFEADSRGRSNYTKKPTEYVEGKTCPTCGGRLILITTKTGKKLHQCEHRKYDFTTKTTTGCDYVEWLEEDAQSEPSNETAATPAQRKILEDKGLWVDGLSKLKASKLISEALSK